VKQAHPCAVCSLGKNAAVHWGAGDEKHPYQGEARQGFGSQRQPLSPRSESPGRVQKAQETREAMQDYREAVDYCEGPEMGLPGPCEGPLDVHHVIARGSGGGKDYKKFRRLCRGHHRYTELHRKEAHEKGLLEHAPRPDKVVPRRVEQKPPVRRRWEDD